jgi:hypothetical protein
VAGHGLQRQRQVQILGEERAGVDGEGPATPSKDCSARGDKRVGWGVSREGRSARLGEALPPENQVLAPPVRTEGELSGSLDEVFQTFLETTRAVGA